MDPSDAGIVVETVFTVQVQFGDCGPANIILSRNFSRWMDAATEHFFQRHGVPPWGPVEDLPGLLGAPLLESHVRFVNPATHPDTLLFYTRVEAWRAKVFMLNHRVMRGDTLVCEARETRAFCALDDQGRLRALPIPASLRSRFE